MRRNNECQDLTTEKREKQSRQNQTQSNLSPEFIVPSDESETRRNNECQDLTTEKRRENDPDKTTHSPTFRRNSSSLVMNPSTRRNNECQDLTTRRTVETLPIE